MDRLVNLIPNSAQLQGIFSQAAAPAFLLGAAAAFISILMTRLAGLVERIRHLRDPADGATILPRPHPDLLYLRRRAELLHGAIFLALLAGIATTLLLMVMAASGFLGLAHIYGAGLLFGLATVLFTLSLIRFAQEVRLALHELRDF